MKLNDRVKYTGKFSPAMTKHNASLGIIVGEEGTIKKLAQATPYVLFDNVPGKIIPLAAGDYEVIEE